MKTQFTSVILTCLLLTYALPLQADNWFTSENGWRGWLSALHDDDSSSHDKGKPHDDDDDSSHDKGKHHDEQIKMVTNKTYLEECSSCHFAYQPGLLPVRSWQKLMATLDDHFGDNAELEIDVQQALTTYLAKNAADLSADKFSKKLVRRLSEDKTPLRITKLPYFVHEHDDLSNKMVSDNPEVKSLSYCDKCHTRAGQGDYSEKNISIPGYGRWED